MDWFERDFDHPLYFDIYRDKAADAAQEGPALAGMLDLPEGSRVLDLPCGWGRLLPHLQAKGWRVVGGDLSALNLARHQAEQEGERIRLDLRSLNLFRSKRPVHPFRPGQCLLPQETPLCGRCCLLSRKQQTSIW